MTIGLAIKRTSSGDLETYTNSDGFLDFRLVEGGDEVAQAIGIGLLTRQGEDPTAVSYGLPIADLVGIFNSDLIANLIRAQVLRDGRVQRVNRVQVELSNDERQARIATAIVDVKLKDGTNLTVTEAFGA